MNTNKREVEMMKKLTPENIDTVLDIVMNSTGKNTIDQAIEYLNKTLNAWEEVVGMFQDDRFVGYDYTGPITKIGILAALNKAKIPG